MQSEPVALTYRIDMTKDMLDHLELGSGTTADRSVPVGDLTFTYFEDDDSAEARFTEPQVVASSTGKSNPQGMLWLLDILKMLEGTTP